MKRIIIFIMFFSILFTFSADAAKVKKQAADVPDVKAETFKGLTFRNIGPALTSGRISDIAIHPFKRGTWYVCAGSGNLWKTVNAGTTWEPIFENYPSYSIGCIAIDPVNPEVLWLGTGENSSGRHVGYGDGIYKSLNGGKTWENMGLKETQHISKILINSENTDIIYVASEGPLWSAGGERGVFKSSDGGKSWKNLLLISKDTGVVDIAFEPGRPETLYAAAYQRRRSVASFLAGGPESGIYKSADAGTSWRRLKVGLPKGDMGRIGLAVSPMKPNVVYATIEGTPEEMGFYRSADRGESWEKQNAYVSGGTGAHYYQEIFADPHVFDRVYQTDMWLHVTEDGGKTFSRVKEKHKHSDNHALAFDLLGHNSNYLLAGCDGGVYETWDRGETWRYIANLPVTQFYKIALDNSEPFYNIHGGTQDNGTQMGPSRTLTIQGVRTQDWVMTYGADGHACAVDPTDPNIVYVEWQDGHPYRYDHRSGENVAVRPYEEPGEAPLRWNWDSPILVSPHSHTRIYYGAQKLFRSDDRGDSWTVVSPDLTRNIDRFKQPIMGRTWGPDAVRDHEAMSTFSTTTIISESPVQEGLIYVGTDDGLIQVTEDGGANWRKAAPLPGVPEYFYVNDLKAGNHDKFTVFAAVDNHKSNDLKPYLFKSTDAGRSWSAISGDLPKPLLIWSVAQDHVNKDLLFIGAETGIFFTLDGGSSWLKFTGGLPTISFRDIEIQKRENDLVGGSFGRSIFVLDDYSPLRDIDSALLQTPGHLFKVKKTLMYIPRKPLEMEGKGFQGDDYFITPNPPFGAVFTYYLKESLKSQKQLRQEAEKVLAKAGGNEGFPSWAELEQEEREDPPVILLTVKDQSGRVVRHLEGPILAGIHRVAWDLRYPSLSPTELTVDLDMDPWDRPPQGPLVVPGRFSVSLAKRVKGVLTPLGQAQDFQVESLGLNSLGEKDRKALLAFQAQAGKLQRAVMGTRNVVTEALRSLTFIKKALTDTPEAGPELSATALALEGKLKDALIVLLGEPVKTKRRFLEPQINRLQQRINIQVDTTFPVTKTALRNYEIAADGFTALRATLKQLLEIELPALQKQMEKANAPWTPGRGLPEWEK